MLFGDRYETSTTPYSNQITSTNKYQTEDLYKKQITSAKKNENLGKMKLQEVDEQEELREKILAKKKKEDMLEKQRIKPVH